MFEKADILIVGLGHFQKGQEFRTKGRQVSIRGIAQVKTVYGDGGVISFVRCWGCHGDGDAGCFGSSNNSI